MVPSTGRLAHARLCLKTGVVDTIGHKPTRQQRRGKPDQAVPLDRSYWPFAGSRRSSKRAVAIMSVPVCAYERARSVQVPRGCANAIADAEDQ